MTDGTRRRKRDEAMEQRDERSLSEVESLSSASDASATSDSVKITEARSEITSARTATKTSRARRTGARKGGPKKPQMEAETAYKGDVAVAEQAASVLELESQGFSPEEARKLIDISKRLESSSEARESRRLHFTRWLVERGILDEFSA